MERDDGNFVTRQDTFMDEVLEFYSGLHSVKNIIDESGSDMIKQNLPHKQLTDIYSRAVASLTVPGGQEFHFPHFFLKF